MIPALVVADDDPPADHTLLEAIAEWTERYTPLVAIGKQQEAWSAAGATRKQKQETRSGEAATGKQYALMLDITGSSHLFGGEAALLTDLTMRLGAQGFLAAAAVADTPGAAAAVARFGGPPVVPAGGAADVLRPLPLAALRLDHETLSALDRTGLKRIGQIIDTPRAPLAARFGSALIRRLDQALGWEEEAINPRRPVPAMIAERRFAEPITREEDIAATLASLAATLARCLETHGFGARHLELAFFRVDGAVKRIAVGAGRPLRDSRLILDLFREKFAGLGEAIDMGFGFDMARLSVLAAAPADPAQIDLAGNISAAADLDGLIDRVGARLGSDRITRIRAEGSHIPERAAKGEEARSTERETRSEEARSADRETRGEEAQSADRETRGEEARSADRETRGEEARSADRETRGEEARSADRETRGEEARSADRETRGEEARSADRETKNLVTNHPERTAHNISSGNMATENDAPISRPLRLFAKPEPVEAIAEVPDGPPIRFRWRRVLYQVVRAEGPERIAPEWWRDDDLTRDYFRVEDPTGHRFWLFREGLYGRELITPRWYLHGVFG